MAAEELHVGDIGTTILVTIKDDGVVVDVSSATTISFLLCKPDGTVETKVGSLNTTGVDGKVKYVTISGDLDVHGRWKYQVYVVIGTGEWYSDVGTFTVHKNLS